METGNDVTELSDDYITICLTFLKFHSIKRHLIHLPLPCLHFPTQAYGYSLAKLATPAQEAADIAAEAIKRLKSIGLTR